RYSLPYLLSFHILMTLFEVTPMDSHPYEKTPGEGGASAPDAAETPAPDLSATQVVGTDACTFVNAKGGRCRMFIVHRNEVFCPHHLNQQRRAEQRHAEQVSANLLQNMLDFSSPTSVNIFLGNLLRELTLRRIDRKDALAMAYIGQMLLNSHAD